MRHTVGFGVLVVVLAWWFTQTAGAQGTHVVPFQEQDDELQGTILIVEPQNNLLIVGKNSIPYSFKIATATRITVSNRPANLEDLEARKGQRITVMFRVTRNGNIAQEILVPGGPTSLSRTGRRGMPHRMYGLCPMRGGAS